MNTIQRIKNFIDYKGISIRAFEQSVEMSNGSFASQLKNNKTIGVDKLENILHSYPEINPNWLLTGNGGMLKDDGKSVNQSIIGNDNVQAMGNSKAGEHCYYGDSPDILKAQINLLNERIKEKDAQIKEKDTQINKLLSILSNH
ncbi:MAG: hypothetical protein LBT27_07035 [Prevotellaceae bacterium]|jgi:hypothetical protein|nr:hypothetical protein [Prevotellaceae bacterium]